MKLSPKRPTVPSLRGLPTSRAGSLALALACAGAAALIIVLAISQYRSSISTANKQDTVLVATGLIQKGTSAEVLASEGLFKAEPVLEKHLAPGAITNAAALLDSVALGNILPGQQLTQSEFALGGGLVGQLTPGERAVSVALDSAHGMLDVLQAGDHVDVYGGFNVQNDSGPQIPVTRLLISNAVVLKAPGNMGGGGLSGGSQGGNVVLGVTNSQVPTLAFASDNGRVWLVLRPGSAQNANQSLTSLDSILFNQQPKLGPSAAGLTLKYSGSLTVASAQQSSGNATGSGNGSGTTGNTTGGHP